MNSFNHYAYGAIGDWMYKHITGIQPVADQPGYREFVISPKMGGGLTSAKASLESPYGTIRSAWSLDGNQVTLEVDVPANTKARVNFNGADGTIKDGLGAAVAATGLTVGSGTYRFVYTIKKD